VGLGTVVMSTPCARLIARLLPRRPLAGADLVRSWTVTFMLSLGALWLAIELWPLMLPQIVQYGACLGIVGAPLAIAAAGWAVATGRHRRGFLADILQFARHLRRHR